MSRLRIESVSLDGLRPLPYSKIPRHIHKMALHKAAPERHAVRPRACTEQKFKQMFSLFAHRRIFQFLKK